MRSFEKSSVKYSSEYLRSAKTQTVDSMSPDREIPDDRNDLAYSVLVGPFSSEKEARILKKEMTEDFDGVVIVKKGKGFLVFIGNEPSAEMAVSLKVRLAEEFGLNGKIVQRRNDNGREYIYGD
ncbi:MAG TPA: SPOR domain-containing protein [Spirochaetota bacterium]|nr:SPOR domain-containing protein [Spirochaetota bacterium]